MAIRVKDMEPYHLFTVKKVSDGSGIFVLLGPGFKKTTGYSSSKHVTHEQVKESVHRLDTLNRIIKHCEQANYTVAYDIENNQLVMLHDEKEVETIYPEAKWSLGREIVGT